MSAAVVYYSYGGTTKKLALDLASKRGAKAIEIRDVKRYTFPGTFFKGCPAAIKQRATPIVEPQADFKRFDKIILMAPVWAGFPAPAFNSIAKRLPRGMSVEVILVSTSGDSSKSRGKVTEMLEDLGLKVTGYSDIKNK